MDAQVGRRLAPDRLQETGHPLLCRDGDQEPGYLVGSPDGAAGRESLPSAVGHERHPRREDLHERFEVPRGGRFKKTLGYPSLLGLIGLEAGMALADVVASAAGELTDRLLLAPEDVGDLGV